MRRNRHFLSQISLLTIVLLLAVLLIIVGCRARPGVSLRLIPDDFRKLYALALDAYLAGNYSDASYRFQWLAETTTDLKLRRKALFGLACVFLVVADSDEGYRDALIHWYNWSQLLPQNPEHEDPRLITPLLSRLRLQAVEDSKTSSHLTDNNDPCTRCQAVRDLSKFKRELKQKIDEARLLRKQLAALQNQLNNLERLHQEIELRKKKVE